MSFSFKWKSVRVCPTQQMTNAIELSASKKYKIDSLEEYIDAELEEQGRIFKLMNCDPSLAKKAHDALEAAYKSSQ